MQDFLAFIGVLRDGQAIEDYKKALVEMEERVAETGKAGVLTIQITMKPASKGNRSAFAFTDKVVTKLPAGETGETLLFAGEGGRLSRRDPRQPELPQMRAVKVDTGTGEIEEAVNG